MREASSRRPTAGAKLLESEAYKVGNSDAKRYSQGGAENVTEPARNV